MTAPIRHGVPGQTHCGRWIPLDDEDRSDLGWRGQRLICTREAGHRGDHWNVYAGAGWDAEGAPDG